VLISGCVRKADTRRSWNAGAATHPVRLPSMRSRGSSQLGRCCRGRVPVKPAPRRTVIDRVRAETAFPAAASTSGDQHNWALASPGELRGRDRRDPLFSCAWRAGELWDYARAVEAVGGTTFSIHPLMTSNT